LFIVGVFSLLDVILGIPLEKIVEKLSLPDAIIEALVHRRGIYGPFISIAEACEKGDFVTLDTLATQNLLDAGFINKCHLDAISWVETLGV
jgi:EAL and modified HD-GYP domain-containing signal transduction protein